MNHYMSFGISGDTQSVAMLGADVTLAFIDSSGRGQAVDYSLENLQQCTGTDGVCPDEVLGFENHVELLEAKKTDASTRVVYRKPLKRGDSKDIVIDVNEPMYTVWAVGPLNDKQEASYHNADKATKQSDTRVRFARSASTATCRGYGSPTSE